MPGPDRFRQLLDRAAQRRAASAWARSVSLAEKSDPAQLKALRSRARATRREIDRVIRIADARLAQSLGGTATVPQPLHSDWAWRPELWSEPVTPFGRAALDSPTSFGTEATVFHDCRLNEIAVRQLRNLRPSDPAPFGIRFDVLNFEGSFLSLVLDLPDEALRGLTRDHVFRLGAEIDLEKPLEVFVRLNVRHGPNTEQIVRELAAGSAAPFAEFDLAYSKLNEKRVEKAWVDIIFERPELNQIVLRDVTMSRRLRAAL